MAHRGECWPAWCPERLYAKFEGDWIELMKKQFVRKDAEEFVLVSSSSRCSNPNTLCFSSLRGPLFVVDKCVMRSLWSCGL